MLSLAARNDSWQNLLSGLGSARDKSSYTHFSADYNLPYDYLEHLYMNDDMSARICELVPHEMLRQGINIKVDGEDFKYQGLQDCLLDALIKSRIFGAAFIYIGADDGQVQDQPLLISKVKAFKFINVLSAKELSFKKFYNDPQDPRSEVNCRCDGVPVLED